MPHLNKFGSLVSFATASSLLEIQARMSYAAANFTSYFC